MCSMQRPNTSSRILSSKKCSLEKHSVSIELGSDPSQDIVDGEISEVRKSRFDRQENSWDKEGAIRIYEQAMENEIPA